MPVGISVSIGCLLIYMMTGPKGEWKLLIWVDSRLQDESMGRGIYNLTTSPKVFSWNWTIWGLSLSQMSSIMAELLVKWTGNGAGSPGAFSDPLLRTDYLTSWSTFSTFALVNERDKRRPRFWYNDERILSYLDSSVAILSITTTHEWAWEDPEYEMITNIALNVWSSYPFTI